MQETLKRLGYVWSALALATMVAVLANEDRTAHMPPLYKIITAVLVITAIHWSVKWHWRVVGTWLGLCMIPPIGKVDMAMDIWLFGLGTSAVFLVIVFVLTPLFKRT